MPKTHSSQPFIKWVAVAAVLAVITACGGGGGGNDDPPDNPTPTPSPIPTPLPTPEPDTTPETFSFTAVTDVERGAVVLSEAATITGIDNETSVMVENGEYSIGGAAFTSEEGTIGSGDQITLRTTASSEFATSVDTVLTVGGVSATFTVTTDARDVSPDQFSFTDQEGVDLGTETESDPVTIQGINDSAPVSIEGGYYSIDGGEFTNVDGTIEFGESIVVRGVSASEVLTDVNVILTVGDVDGIFTITTFPDVTAPIAEIHFPTPVSLTEGTSILVRGTASDDYSAIESVLVNGEMATSDDGFTTWTAEVNLTEGVVNPISVSVTDQYGNMATNADSVNVTQGDINVDFIDSNDRFTLPRSLVLDGDRILLTTYDDDKLEVIEVQIDSGLRSSISALALANNDQLLEEVTDTVLEPAGEQLLQVGEEQNGVYGIDLASGSRTLFSGDGLPGVTNLFERIASIDVEGSMILVSDSLTNSLISVNPNTREQSVLSSNAQPSSGVLFEKAGYVEIDDENDLAYVSDTGSSSLGIYAVSLFDGFRTVLSNATTPDANNPFSSELSKIVLDRDRDRLLVADARSIIAVNVDQETPEEIGARTILADAETPNAINPVSIVTGMAVDSNKDILYVSGINRNGDSLYVIDLVTGRRIILSNSLHF